MTQALTHEHRRYTLEEYFKIDSDSQIRHEHVQGQIIDMAGGTDRHSQITFNLIGELRSRLRAASHVRAATAICVSALAERSSTDTPTR